MALIDLFKGIAVVIDDEIDDVETNITKIIKQIESIQFPILKLKKIPSEEEVNNFANISFLLLDWDLSSSYLSDDEKQMGVKIPSSIYQDTIEKNIEFIKVIKKISICPIFIFSNLDINTITEILTSNGIISDSRPNNILIKTKSEISEEEGFVIQISKWISENSPIYLFKEWEDIYNKSKIGLFSEFLDISPIWPRILWKNYETDGINQSMALIEFISQNINSRIIYRNLESDILVLRESETIDFIELRKLLEGQSYISGDSLDPSQLFTGDLYKIRDEYLLNIRASCDLVYSRTPTKTIDDVDLYLISGKVLSEKKCNELFDNTYGHFKEIDCQVIVFCVNNGIAIDFRFQKLQIIPYREIKDRRIGRILPPIITKIQHKYAHFFYRQGIPRIPIEAMKIIAS